MKNLKFYMLTVFLFTQFYASAQEIFDPSFGDNGIMSIGSNEITDVHFQGEDKLIACSGDWGTGVYNLFRLNLDGSLDETFGNNGLCETTGHYEGVWRIVLDSEGNIYMGSCTNENTIKVTKVTQNGTLDESFGNNGQAEISTSNVAQTTYIDNVAIDNNGRLIASGKYQSLETGNSRIIVARFNPDGSVDNDFGENGLYLNPEIPNQNEQRNTGKTLVNTDNSIIITGYVSYEDYTIGPLAVKIKPDGTIDETFAEDGMFRPNFDGYFDLWGGALMDDNSIVLCGSIENTEFIGMVTKLSADGELDISFGNNGYAEGFNGGQDSIVTYYDAIVNNNEIILIGDIMELINFSRIGIITKLNLDGSVVDNYGENGSMLLSGTEEYPGLRAFAITEKDDAYYCAGTLLDDSNNKQGTIFKMINLDTYTIIFHANAEDATGEMQPMEDVNGTVALTANAFTRDGYEFTGWATTAGGEKVYDDEATVNVTTNMDLYAVWTSVSSITNKVFGDVKIYPNPASDFVHINSENTIESVSIYNTVGQKIFEETMTTNDCKINTSQLEKGFYLVKAKINGSYTSMKILIE